MELSRERKIFLGIFGTALVALGVDRGLLGPSQASAASGAPAPVTSVIPGSAPTASAELAPASGSVGATLALFAERLEGLGKRIDLDPVLEGDAVKTPASWLEVEAEESASGALRTPAGPPTFRLTSVMPTKRGGIAVIEGRTYRQGETIGDFVLEAVEPRSVVLRRDGQLYRLTLSARP